MADELLQCTVIVKLIFTLNQYCNQYCIPGMADS